MALQLTQEQKAAGWQIKQIREIATVVTGGTPSKNNPEHWGDNTPFLTPSDQVFGVRQAITSRFLSVEGKEPFSRRMVDSGAVAITCIGATIGKASYVQVPTVTNQQINSLVADEKQAHGLYLYYLFTTLPEELYAISSGSAKPIVSKSVLENFEVAIPSYAEQKGIAEILGSMDDKIEANSRLLNSLSELGSALMRREISASITTAPLSEIAEITMGQSPAGDSLNEEGEGAIFYQGRCDFGFRYPTQRVYTTAPTRIVDEGDILLSVRAPVGDLNRTDKACCVGHGVAAIRAKDGNTSQLFYLLKESPQLWEPFEGEGTIFSSINRKQLHKLSVPLISQNAEYENIEENIKSLTIENKILADTRDFLIRHLIG
ncbi:restriction endonuclease subunit S [Rothia sp. L_38]|uniref:restriction endonuclease subunit S n=1 Tax=Rothia sp. L_38 TaxID=3422315 RepID=UPI003D6BFA25